MSTYSFSQTDKIYKHTGEIIKGKITKVSEFTIEYSYEDEEAVQSISKYAVDKVFYGKSTRIEDISEKIEVEDKDDWRNVLILEDKALVAGLKKMENLKAKTGWINLRTGNGKDEKAEKRLKKQAAEEKCTFILLVSDKTVGVSAKKTGSCYKYN